LHFKLATRKSSSSISKEKSNEEQQQSPKNDKQFEKALNDTSKESDLNKRIKEIKQNYDSYKLEDLVAKLKDAESRNEYLTNIITQLQSKRNINSGHRPNNVNSLNSNTSNNNNNQTNTTSKNANNSRNTTIFPKLNINHIYSIEPFRIKFNDGEEPRTPTNEEIEMLVKKLFNTYKLQKQQVIFIL
jgi:hypothetical protein